MSIGKRLLAPTPSFFQKVRKWGLIIGGIGAAIIAAPITLPSIIVTVAGYLAVAGTVAVAVSQAATTSDAGEAD
jgi:ABC-type xylose transport system permease subunit